MRRWRYIPVVLVLILVGIGLGGFVVGRWMQPAVPVPEPVPNLGDLAAPFPPDGVQAAAVRVAARAPSGPQAASVRAGYQAAAAGVGAMLAPDRGGGARYASHAVWSAAQFAGVAPPAAERLSRVPVLMYHELGDVENGLYVRVADFAAQLAYLAEAGYQPISMDALYDHFVHGRPLPRKPVVITFDDGYRSFWEVAVPLLQQYEYPAIVFVITELVGNARYVTWDQLRALPAMGFEVGSHTATHPDLRLLGDARLQQEIAGSRELLARELGQEVRYFCYPVGLYNDNVVQAVRDAGYLAAVTTQYGPATPEQDHALWARVRIERRDTLTTFAKKLAEASE